MTITDIALCAAVAAFVILELIRWWKRYRKRRRYVKAVSSANIRPTTIPFCHHDIRDDCLRRGFDLPSSEWIANRTAELDGDQGAAEQEWANLRG